MKTPHAIRSRATAVALACTAGAAMAGQVVISNFDDPNDATLWSWESWSDPASTEFATTDAGGGGAGSGSMKVINSFPDRPTGYSQAVVTWNLGANVDAETLYTNISLDVKLDPASYPRVNGTQYGGLELITRNGSAWTWTSLGYYELTAANTNWTHLNFPIKAPADAVHHLTLKLGQNNLTNTVTYYVDNVRWDEAAVQIPPPTMSIEKTRPGLNLLAASSGQYDRQGIATVNGNFGWIGSATPVSYSMTIKEFPKGATYPGFSTRFFLVPGSPGTEEYPDWTEPNCIIVDIYDNANGTGTATFHYKTNAPNSNGINNQYFNNNPTNGPVGQLGSVNGASVLGTWTVAFNQDTNITLTAPDGTAASMVMPPEDAAQFAGDIKVYFAAVPGQTANIGQHAVLSRVQIKSGSQILVDDNFSTAPLNPDVWMTRAASPAGVSLITQDEPFYLYWTTPASGFTLQFTPDLKSPNWTDPALTDQLVGVKKRVLVLLQTHQALRSAGKSVSIPNYIETTLEGVQFHESRVELAPASLNTFQVLWNEALKPFAADVAAGRIHKATVLEPACGSANDYRVLEKFGFVPLIEYRGFDLCEKNIANAREMFPDAGFAVGNVFAIDSPDAAWDLCFVHDLLEHLSIEGLRQAVSELCRATRHSLCVHFFNMDETRAHVIHPVEDYHWNTLSMGRMRELFATSGFTGHVVHIGSYVRHHTGCEACPNPNAYTFYLHRGI